VKLLLNPMVLRLGMLLLITIAAFVVGAIAIRRTRKSLVGETDSFAQSPLAAEGLPIHSYHAVIQQLKQQKHELQSEQQIERRRAKASENISAAVLSNLSSGVVFFTPTVSSPVCVFTS